MESPLAIAALTALAAGLGYVLGRKRRGARSAPPAGSAPRGSAGDGDPRTRLYALAQAADEEYPTRAHPRDLMGVRAYAQGVELLQSAAFGEKEVCRFAVGDNAVLSCMALDALRRRTDGGQFLDELLPGINKCSNWALWIFCELLEARHPAPALERILLVLDTSWDSPMGREVLKDCFARRLAQGETVQVDARFVEAPRAEVPFGEPKSRIGFLAGLIEEIGTKPALDLAQALRARTKSDQDVQFLHAVGRVLASDSGPAVLEHPQFVRALGESERVLERSRALLVAGAPGVGRSTLVRALAERFRARGFTIFEAGSSDLLAGQSMMGQLEGRLQKLLPALADAPIVWIVPDFTELVWAGRHRFGTTSVLDTLMPWLEAGRLRIVARIEPEGLERLLRAQPRLRDTVDVVRLAPPSERETLELGRRWAEDRPIAEATLKEAAELARQYLGQTAAPGNLLGLLRLASEGRAEKDGAPLAHADLLAALTRLTGLSAAMLDEHEALDLEALRRLFGQRVLAQPEAVDCLVERVALQKAGLVDPGRPAGVFLFTGPTGTGKTEIARTLAEFLFGSPERLVRVDMSELTGPLARTRLVGSLDEQTGDRPLVQRIREQPFAVVLLDEIEKADPGVWDLFLQVFDAGRLTDAHGRVADFRHAIFILTSNLGAERLVGERLGFGPRTPGAANVSAVLEELSKHFRPEFLNRIDRTVVFRPLGRAVMRRILEKELERALALRGLRTRQWVVEWDESALEFLLERGFSPTQGARPLRRAIERWFLSPLALAIVNRDAPSGDQFLFVRSNGQRIDVVFVDPDGPSTASAEPTRPVEVPEGLTLGRLALEGAGSRAEVAFLAEQCDHLAADVRGERWRAAQDAALARLSEPGFWAADERFAVLSSIEHRERVETGLAHAERLLARVRSGKGGAIEIVRQLAHQLYLVDAAARTELDLRPRDAFLSVEALRDARDGPLDAAFARRVAEMYRAWAKNRRMQMQELELVENGETWRWVAAVSGYGAHSILERESGWHVMEVETERDPLRQRVRVCVRPQPERPLDDALGEARRALAGHAAKETHVVRRYRELPSPLVRDSVRAWRTGRLDRVLGGDFDLL